MNGEKNQQSILSAAQQAQLKAFADDVKSQTDWQEDLTHRAGVAV